MFIVQQRHNYNKAMLGVISDNIYREAVIPEWKTTFSSYMNVFSEKKVETFHSLLRMQCPSWSSAEQIIEFAQVISANGFDHEFSSNFLTDPPKKTNKQSVTILAGKSAEYLVTKFEELQAKFPPKTSSAISKTVPRMTTPLFCSAVGTHFMMRACMKTGAATASLTY